jgi:hypothetical protein
MSTADDILYTPFDEHSRLNAHPGFPASAQEILQYLMLVYRSGYGPDRLMDDLEVTSKYFEEINQPIPYYGPTVKYQGTNMPHYSYRDRERERLDRTIANINTAFRKSRWAVGFDDEEDGDDV